MARTRTGATHYAGGVRKDFPDTAWLPTTITPSRTTSAACNLQLTKPASLHFLLHFICASLVSSVGNFNELVGLWVVDHCQVYVIIYGRQWENCALQSHTRNNFFGLVLPLYTVLRICNAALYFCNFHCSEFGILQCISTSYLHIQFISYFVC